MKILEKIIKMYYYMSGRGKERIKGNTMDAVKLSRYVIRQFRDQGKNVTNLKLQKVMYYIQGYFFKDLGYAAFDDDMCCWPYGPVVPIVYYEYNSNRASVLHYNGPLDVNLSSKERNLIQKIVKKCAEINTADLVDMTHQEDPWKQSQSGSVISKALIKKYFEKCNPLGI